MMTIDLTGKRVLVTGASSGLGAAIATALAEAGARVAVNYAVNADGADQVVAAIRAKQGEAFPLIGDISDEAAVEAMFCTLDEKWGGLDILVNNAGTDGARALGWEGELNAWKKVIAINLTGAFQCAHEALKRMIPKKIGVVINITSVHETIAWSGFSAYAASKAGLAMVTKTLAQEAAPHGVRVLAIAPGAIKTPINRSVWADSEGYRDLLTKIPLKRIGEPEDVAHMVVFLASDFASYVTGTTVFVDGGMTDYPQFAEGG